MISTIVLAAGQSKRMNGDNKLIKKYKKKYLINHILITLIKSTVDKIIVVLGFQDSKVRRRIVKNKKINFVFNKNYKSGMASSIKTGLKRISKKNIGFLIVQADMPLISKKIINSLCHGIRKKNKEIVAPIYKKNIGNPIGFKSSMIKILNETKGDSGAKKMIKRNKKNISLIKINSKSIFKDFNTQRDFLLN
jgi:molybdenum cofactor cytidylyltransferase|tara:strand:- start:18 stop:596 length:579 start_codon:yes stop_codon:yes gene_type:complete